MNKPKFASKITEAKYGKDGYVLNASKGNVGVVAYTTGRGKNKKTFQVGIDSVGIGLNPNFWVEAEQLLIKKLRKIGKI